MKTIFYNKKNKLRSLWWIFIFFIILFLILLPVVLASHKFSFEISIPLQGLIVILATWICQLISKSSLSEITGKFDFTAIKYLLVGMGIGVLLMLVPATILFATNYVEFSINNISNYIILEGVVICLSVAVTEELLFRGFIFQRLIKSIGQWPAQLVIALLFLLTHSNGLSNAGDLKWWGSLNIFLASIMFGIAYIRTNSLALPIGIHFMANLMQGTVLGFGVSGQTSESILITKAINGPSWMHGGNFGLEASLLGLLMVITMIIFLSKRRGLFTNLNQYLQKSI